MKENLKNQLEQIINESELHEDCLTRKMFYTGKYPEYKQFVIAITTRRLGLDITRRLGRVIQIRLKTGAFSSDTYLIRLLNGDLVIFENELFYGLLKHEEEKVKALMQYEGDNQSMTYTLGNEFPEKGFLVNSNYRNGIQSFSMVITKSKEN